MPLYPCRCNKCGKTDEVARPVSQCRELPDCCGEMMQRVYTPLHVIEDMKPYKSPLDGKMVTSRKEHRDHMVRHGVIEAGNEKMTRSATKKVEPNKEEIKQDLYDAMKRAEEKAS